VHDGQRGVVVTDGSDIELDVPNVQVVDANAMTVRGIWADVFFLYNVGTDQQFYREGIAPLVALNGDTRVYHVSTI